MQDSALKRRRAAAERYRPARVKLLVVAEAPPCDTDRYFYFEEVDRHDWLFRYVFEGVTGEKPTRHGKASHLRALQDAGVFMIDLHERNVSEPTMKQLQSCVTDLVERVERLKPERVVLVKSIVFDAAYEHLKEAGVPVMNHRLPFPASGQQRRFLEGFRQALDGA